MSDPAVQPTDQFQYVKLPDGSYGKFLASAPDDQIKAAIGKDFPSAYSDDRTWFDKGLSTLGDTASGVAKSALQPAAQLSGVISKVPFLSRLTGVTPESAQGFQQQVQTQGLPEKIGGGLEQAAEMFATGGPLKAGAEALATKLPFLGKFAAPAMRIGAEALNTGANAGAHGEPVGPAAATGAGGAGIAESLPFLAPYVKKLAQKQYSRVLAPTKQTTKNITQEVVPQLLDDRQVALSRSGLQQTADANVDNLGNQITQKVSQLPPPAPYSGPLPQPLQKSSQNVIDLLEDFKQRSIVNGVPVDPEAVNRATELQGIIRDLGPDVTPQDINKVRQIWDKKVAQAGGYAGKTMAEGSMLDAQRAGANAIRSEFASANPDIAAINKQFHFWKGVSDVLEQTEQRTTGQFGGLGKLVAPIGGFVGGMARGGYTQGAEGAAIMLAANQALQSTLWRTTSAVLKNELANAMMTGSAQKVAQVVTRITAGTVGQQAVRP